MRTTRKDYLAHIEELQKRSGDTVAKHIAERRALTPSQPDPEDDATFGQRAADAVARFGGSWTFIMLFALVLVSWVVLNSFLLTRGGAKPFDPFPYILLNLFLSMLASIQAPVILMSQNRQGEIDRLNAQNDYEINLKAELEIMALHEKMDAFKLQLVEMQHEQLRLLNALCEDNKVAT
ncbi:cyclic nucleotide-binding protein [Massilia violaceinigra]|uniref:Cyclic nucleotide-binding protein n=1 Tax=Massilia violaceinigra TaxID=2045208 RepID=A0A2D2DDY6_9BURK|nr:DUF1003 domain-containing protein [Massilia violaceinigra]ATQ73205.1 cyclic nucleotide-binding protein [Massilia violaceinigra]